MDKVRLSKSEKQVLRMVADGQRVCPREYPQHTFSTAIRPLKAKGFISAHFREGGAVIDARITDYGRQYMAEYPRLCNPIDWSLVAAVSSIVATIISTLALFVACS